MTPKKRVLFQTPLKPEPLSRVPATPSSVVAAAAGGSRSQMHVLINKGNCASTDCLMEETSLKKLKAAEEEKDSATETKLPTTTRTRTLQRKYPSEPNLKSCYFGINDESDGGSGAEAITAATTGYSAAGVAGKVGVSLWDLVTLARAAQGDESSRERLSSLNGTQQSMLTDDERPSMSPITKSTRRMPKYMQVSEA